MVIDVQKKQRIFCLTALGLFTIVLFLMNPLIMLLVSLGFMGFLAVSRQMNLYKILVIIRNYAKNVSQIRMELRAKLHTGAVDYYKSMENEKSKAQRSSAFAR
jgi:hypothetical protein